ncbi:MAG: flagellar basal body P-ring formation chaperone FlgA [Phycisphaerales bacterium]
MTRQRNNTNRPTPSPFKGEGWGEGLTVGLAAIMVLLLSVVLHADTIVLHDGSSIRTDAVALGDIADLEGPDAIALADVSLGSLHAAASEGSRTFTLAEIRASLDAQHINWGKIDLRGPTRLTVRRFAPDTANTSGGDVAKANPIATINADAPAIGRTLRQLITERIQRQAHPSDDALRIACQDAAAAAWSMTDAEYRFEIEPAARQTLGRIPFNVRCYKHDQLDSVQHLTVDVARQSQVVVTARQLQRGRILVPADLIAQTQWLDSDRVQPVTDPQIVVGQSTTRLIHAGAILQTDDIAPRLLVERGQLVTVRAVSGGIVVKFTARASEDGSAGQVIAAANPRTRETYTVRVTGPQETEMQISSQQSPPPPAVGSGKDPE